MKNRIIRERYSALTVLSRRVLPSPTAVHKVTALLATTFRRAYEATEDGRKKLIVDHPTPVGWEGDTLPAAVAEARQKDLDELMEQEQPIRVSARLKLTSDDLPKVLKREGGESNVEALAEIVLFLGSLYKPGTEELALREPDDDSADQLEE